MSWRAIVPLKGGAERKTRLAGRLSPESRLALSEDMVTHVLDVLAEMGVAARLLSPEPRQGVPWERDLGAGLNAELDRASGVAECVLVIHADLPLLAPADVAAVVAAAEEHGAAIAPDRHGTGTNALALRRRPGFAFAFGAGSFARHRLALPDAAIVRREGLAFDVDTPADLDTLARHMTD